MTESISGNTPEHSRNLLRKINPKGLAIESLRHVTTGIFSWTSTAFLEGVAVFGGGVALGINPLKEASAPIALGCLAASYVFWISGLVVNANQAWRLLEETGVCTSWWAKIGHDVSKRVTDNQISQKAATYSGFTAMEIVKEVPWWIAAIGGRQLILQISPEHYSPNMEISFLMGANIAAAGYNYLQAGGVETILQTLKAKQRIVNILRRGKDP